MIRPSDDALVPSLHSRPATLIALLASVLLLGYVVYTPTNILLGLLPVAVLLGLGYAIDRRRGGRREPDALGE